MINSETSGRVTILTPTLERLDASRATPFRQACEAVLPHPPVILMDLGQIQFMDSTGLGAILSLHQQIKANGGEIQLCNPTKAVRILFDLIRLKRLIGVSETREEALKKFAGEGPGSSPVQPPKAP